MVFYVYTIRLWSKSVLSLVRARPGVVFACGAFFGLYCVCLSGLDKYIFIKICRFCDYSMSTSLSMLLQIIKVNEIVCIIML